MNRLSTEQRALGAFLGFAVGDALGATVEFLTRDEIATRYGVHRKMTGGGWLHLAPGQVTDDTEMSLALGRSLVRCQTFDIRDICEEFAVWLRSSPIDVGNTCRRGIRRYMMHGTTAGEFCDGDAGNGAAMRVLPVALASWTNPEQARLWAVQQGHITHHHPLSDDASAALMTMLCGLLAGEGMKVVRTAAHDLESRHKAFRFDKYRGMASGYIIDTMQTVMHFYFMTDNFTDAVIQTVNQGGDADTTGALVGMLAGATYGVEAIPRAWLSKLQKSAAEEIRRQVPALLGMAARQQSLPVGG